MSWKILKYSAQARPYFFKKIYKLERIDKKKKYKLEW
jgi:hypothetical protein